jgi:hypothetical protein
MSNEFNKELSELYKQVATKQKNTKGVPHMGDSLENFRGRKGVSDVGIPLSPKAAKRKQTNRAGYHYPQHLQNINERRRRDAMARHGITNIEDPFNQKEKKDKTFTQPAVNHSIHWRLPIDDGPKIKKNYNYYWGYSDPEPEPVTYVAPPEPRKQPAYKAKMVKRDSKLQFKNKLEEAIYNHPNYKKQKF